MRDIDLVAEVRKHRADILASFGGSMAAHHTAVTERQRRDYAGRLVTLEPRKRIDPNEPCPDSPQHR